MVRENGMVMLTENELKEMDKKLIQCEKRIALLQTALLNATKGNTTVAGVQVTKTDFLEIYNKALNEMFSKEDKENFDPHTTDIYGYDFTVHWHGIYCNCSDGALPSNHLIPAIEGLNDEDPDECY